MIVTHADETTTLTLNPTELKLLRRALERASFIDTPIEEQPQILAFAALALDQLGEAKPAPARS